ncbi:syndecan-4-like [Dromiciops gliroides]|uniref:syndecan-4-like n=1 Tax=Dromiciops gliroides TaxID=33562 RepID=UPI001CC50381|nr:syndecan-4-like [Dromiciops gliroides]XP_043845734.1 syndecan-4-like [Dromiciops gliroides]
MPPLSFFALLLLATSAIAEWIREMEVMDPRDLYEAHYFSGALPDDDMGGALLEKETDDFILSGSGDMDDTESSETFLNTVEPLDLDNHILEEGEPSSQDPKNNEELEENEIFRKRFSLYEENVSNKVAMSSTAQSSIFEKMEVLAALITGGAMGLLFDIFLVLLLIY